MKKKKRQYNEDKAMLDMQKEKEAVEEEQAKQKLRQQIKKERQLKVQAERETKRNGDESKDDPNFIITGIGALGVGGGALLLTSDGNSDDIKKNITSITSDVEVDQDMDEKVIESAVIKIDIMNGNLTNVSEKLPIKHTDTIDSAVLKMFDVDQSLGDDTQFDFSSNGSEKVAELKEEGGANEEFFSKIFDVEQSLDDDNHVDITSNGSAKATELRKENGANQETVERKPMVYLDIETEDGGDAWLGMLSNIIMEEYNEVDKKSAHKVDV